MVVVMAFGGLVTRFKRTLEGGREEPKPFDFIVSEVTEGEIRDFGRKGIDVPSYRLHIDPEDTRSIVPDYLKSVEIRKNRAGYDIDPFTRRIISGYQQGHNIRFRGERTRIWMTSLLIAFFGPTMFSDFFEGEIIIEDKNTGEKTDSIKTTFMHWGGEYEWLSGIRPIARLPNVVIEQGIAKYLTKVGLDPSTTPYDEEDFIIIYHCGSCDSGGLYSQPRISGIPVQKSIKCQGCGSGTITRVYQNF